MEKNSFNEVTFWPEFEKDLASAQARVLIQSPFLSFSRLTKMTHNIQSLIERNVVVCTFIQEPGSAKDDESLIVLNLLEKLQSMRVHVNLVPKIHAKLAIIDQAILWEGSLNVLSHKNTGERMRRFTDLQEIQQAIAEEKLYACKACEAMESSVVAHSVQDLAKRLAFIRRAQRVSQQSLARRCKITQSRIAKIESGKTDMKLSSLLLLTRQLDYEMILVPRHFVSTVAHLVQPTD